MAPRHSWSPKKHIAFTRKLRVILPIVAAVLVISALSWSSLFEEPFVDAYIDHKHPDVKENRMLFPSYNAANDKGQPYEITAKWGKQLTENTIRLIEPKGILEANDDRSFSLGAHEGLYDHTAQTLTLDTNVILNTNDGYRVETKKAFVDINKKTIEGNVLIEGHGPLGKLIGRHGFKIEDHPQGKILTLKGPSTVIIAARKQKNREKNKL